MIRLQINRLSSVQDALDLLQTAIGVEFGTLPPYLYALYSIRPGTNPQAADRVKSVALQEMIHMCLASNILNALGGAPLLKPPTYPGPLPGDIGPNGTPLTVHLFPLSLDAMKQAMAIEQPEDPPDFPVQEMLAAVAATGPRAMTIGQFYEALDHYLSTLPASAWSPNRNQVTDSQFFPGQLFAINGYPDAHKAIQAIVSEGEGADNSPLDFQGEIAHYYRFGEIYHNKILTKADNPEGYTWGPQPLGVDYSTVYPAICDPGTYDFSKEPQPVQAAQNACNAAFTEMVDLLQSALNGNSGALGQAVSAMFKLRTTAMNAFTVPLACSSRVAGPAFLYQPTKH